MNEVVYHTPREKEIMQLLAEGMTSQQVADKLSIEIFDVHSYLRRMLCERQP